MKPQLNQWCGPEIAKLWPEGSQVIWRIRLKEPSYEKHYRYGQSGWWRPDGITENDSFDYNLKRHGGAVEFMLLELPITR